MQTEPEPSPGVKHVVCEGRLSSRERFGVESLGVNKILKSIGVILGLRVQMSYVALAAHSTQ